MQKSVILYSVFDWRGRQNAEDAIGQAAQSPELRQPKRSAELHPCRPRCGERHGGARPRSQGRSGCGPRVARRARADLSRAALLYAQQAGRRHHGEPRRAARHRAGAVPREPAARPVRDRTARQGHRGPAARDRRRCAQPCADEPVEARFQGLRGSTACSPPTRRSASAPD